MPLTDAETKQREVGSMEIPTPLIDSVSMNVKPGETRISQDIGSWLDEFRRGYQKTFEELVSLSGESNVDVVKTLLGYADKSKAVSLTRKVILGITENFTEEQKISIQQSFNDFLWGKNKKK